MALIASPVFAQDTDEVYSSSSSIVLPDPPSKVPGELDVGPAISPMRWGQKAPFTGVLLSPVAVATVIAELNSVNARIDLEVTRERERQLVERNFYIEQVTIVADADNRILQAQVDSRVKEIDILNERLEKAETSTSNTALWLGGGFVGGVLITVLTTFAVSYASGAR